MRYVVLSMLGLTMLFTGPMSASAQIAKTVPQPTVRIQSFPNASKVEALISDYLGNLSDRQETDLISRDDILSLFEELEDIGWYVSDQREFKERLLDDSDWLVKKLRTRQGTKFMRKIAQYPGGYAQLDLMRESKQGKKEVSGIITTPGGEELIELLTTTKVGRNTSQKLAAQHRSKSKHVAHRLYTKADIYKQLKVSYAAEAERRAKAAAIISRKSTKTKSSGPAPPTTPQPATPSAPTETSSSQDD